MQRELEDFLETELEQSSPEYGNLDIESQLVDNDWKARQYLLNEVIKESS